MEASRALLFVTLVGASLFAMLAATDLDTAHLFARIVELGHGWMPIMGSTPESIATDRERLRRAFASAGRDPDSIAVSDFAQVVRDADGRAQLAETLEASRARAEHGVTMVALSLAGFSSDLAEYPRLVGAVAQRWERL